MNPEARPRPWKLEIRSENYLHFTRKFYLVIVIVNYLVNVIFDFFKEIIKLNQLVLNS